MRDVGLMATSDHEIARFAREQDLALLTENFAHFADERDLILIFVQKRNLASGGTLAPALSALVARWLGDNPRPWIGPHWPR